MNRSRIPLAHLARLALLWLLAAAALSGCAVATGPKFTGEAAPLPSTADVYLYRGRSIFASSFAAFEVRVDGHKIGELFDSSYLWLRLKPGLHTITVDPGLMTFNSERQIVVEAGSVSYYEYHFIDGPLFNTLYIGSGIDPRERSVALETLAGAKSATPGVIEVANAAAFSTVDDVDAVPYLNERGRRGYREWLAKKGRKAFALASNGLWNSAWGTKPADMRDGWDPAERALSMCKRRAPDCRLYAVDNRVVWQQ